MSSVRHALLVITVMLVPLLASARADVDPLGQFTQRIDIDVPVYHQITPRVALRYASDGGNGFVGRGWSVTTGSMIARVSAAHGLPRLDATDIYVLDGDDLIPCTSASTSPSCTSAVAAFGSSTGFYSTRVESYRRIRMDTGGATWTVWDRDGTTQTFKSLDSGKTFPLATVTDTHGNHVDYTYACAGRCPETITYAAVSNQPGMEVRFYSEKRPDPVRAPDQTVLTTRLHSIAVSMNGKPLRAYQLTYKPSLANGLSLLASLQQSGSDATIAADGTVKGGTTLPALTFTTPSMSTASTRVVQSTPTANLPALVPTPFAPPKRFVGETMQYTVFESPITSTGGGDPQPHGSVIGDFDGNGRADWLGWAIMSGCGKIQLDAILDQQTGHDPVVESLRTTNAPASTASVCATRVWSADLDGDRRDDLLVYANGTITKLISDGNGHFTKQSTTLTWSSDVDRCAIGDFDGDGHDDIACTNDDAGVVQLVTARSVTRGTWSASVIDPSFPTGMTLSSHRIAAGDVNGDGRADLVVASLVGTTWSLSTGISNGDGTFAWSTQTTSWPVVSAGEYSIATADFNGDSRADVMFTAAPTGTAPDSVSIGLSIKGASDRFALAAPLGSTWLKNVSVGDYDGDGKADLLVGTTQRWAHGRGNGLFDDPPTTGASISNCNPFAVDLDGDGRADILCVVDDVLNQTYTFTDTPSWRGSADLDNWMSGDVTGDGIADVVYVHSEPVVKDINGQVLQHAGHNIIVVPSGSGPALPYSFYPNADEADTSRFMMADVGGPGGVPDGKADLVMLSTSGGNLDVNTYLSKGDGTFTLVQTQPVDAASQTSMYISPDVQTWRPANLDGNGATDFIHVTRLPTGIDVETLLARGDGSYIGHKATHFDGSVNKFASYDALNFMVTDVNGDGFSDLVYVEPGTGGASMVWTLINQGDGTFVEAVAAPLASFPDMRRIKLADLDGDGLVDLVHLAAAGASKTCPTGGLSLTAYLGNGKGNWTPQTTTVCSATSLDDMGLARFIDIDGDGRDDLVHISTTVTGNQGGFIAHPTLTYATSFPGAGLWSATADSSVASLPASYDYEPWRWHASSDPVTGVLVLTEIQPGSSPQIMFWRASERLAHVGNGVGGSTDVEYQPLIGKRVYLPLGMIPRVVRAMTVGDSVAPKPTSERFTYDFEDAHFSDRLHRMTGFEHTSTGSYLSVSITDNTVDEICGPRPTATTVNDLNGITLASDDVAYVPQTAAAPYRCDAYDRAHYTCASGTCWKMTQTTSQPLDPYGNTTQIDQLAASARSKRVVITIATPNLAAYIVDRATSVATLQYDSQWNQMTLKQFYYDGSASPGGVGAHGDVTTIGQSDGTHYLTTSMTYQPNGMVATVTSPAGTITTTTYDKTYGLYPAIQSVGPLPSGPLVTTLTYSLSTGLLLSTADANGQGTVYTYDPLGRSTRVTQSDGSHTDTTYSISILGGHQVVRNATSDTSFDGIWSDQSLDGLGRVFHIVRKDGASVDTTYADSSNRPTAVSNVYLGKPTTVATHYDYDGLGRVITRTATDKSTETTAFTGLSVTSTDELGHKRTAFLDGRGATNKIEEVNAGKTQDTYYDHDVFGHVTRTIDALGNLSLFSYDPLGRQTSSTTPDTGTSTTVYATNGQVDHVTDAMGQIIKLTYDGIGRVIERDDTGMTAPRTIHMYWDRDAAGVTSGSSLGRLVEVSDDQTAADLSEHYTYDGMGRVTHSMRCVGTICMPMDQTYLPGGYLATTTYPDNEIVRYAYDLMGRQSAVGTYATAVYNELDQLANLTYQNGLTTTTVYDPARHWTNSVTAQIGTQPSLYTATYTHEVTGRIHTLSINTGTPVNEQFTYDDLGRLTMVASDPAHTEAFSYDELGRFLTSSHNGKYTYGDPRHVHAPTSTATGDTRVYNPDGNLVALTDASGRSLTLLWTADGHVSQTTNKTTGQTAAFVYDRNGARAAKMSSTTELFFGPLVEQRGGVLVKYYMVGGHLVARNDGKVSYYTQDHRGSTRIVTDAAGTLVNHYDYAAFGRSLGKVEGVAQDFEQGGGRLDDEDGLTYMNARYYDDEVASFISADTIIPNIHRPQSHNRYSYTEQDPVNYADPSGHMKMQAEWKLELDRQAARVDRAFQDCYASFGCDGLNESQYIDHVYDNLSPALKAIADNMMKDLKTKAVNSQTGQPAADTTTPAANGDPSSLRSILGSLVSGVLDVFGKVWNLPNTVIGVTAGLVGWALGGDAPTISHNAIVFANNPIASGGAITLGNAILIGPPTKDDPDWGPNCVLPNGGTVLEHEEQHTYQGQLLGPLYLLVNGIAGAISVATAPPGTYDQWHFNNFMENGPQSSPPAPWP